MSKKNLHTSHSGNLLQLRQSFYNPWGKLTFILDITFKDFRSLLYSPSKDQCVLVILVLDIAQPNKKLRIHLKREVGNEFDLGLWTLLLCICHFQDAQTLSSWLHLWRLAMVPGVSVFYSTSSIQKINISLEYHRSLRGYKWRSSYQAPRLVRRGLYHFQNSSFL